MSPNKSFIRFVITCNLKILSFSSTTKISAKTIKVFTQNQKHFTRPILYSKWRGVQLPNLICMGSKRTLLIQGLKLVYDNKECVCVVRVRKRSLSVPGISLWNTQFFRNLAGIVDHDLWCSAAAVARRSICSGIGKDSSDKENDNDTKKPPEIQSEAYDPKKDNFFTQDNAFGSKENKGRGEAERPVFIPEEENSETEDLSAPTNCCQSGCHNCVWIEYAEKLSKRFSDPKLGRDKILQELNEMEDQNIKAFIMMELRVKKII